MSKNYSRIAIAILLGAVIGLTWMNYHQAQLIHVQRQIILDMYRYIITGCPQ